MEVHAATPLRRSKRCRSHFASALREADDEAYSSPNSRPTYRPSDENSPFIFTLTPRHNSQIERVRAKERERRRHGIVWNGKPYLRTLDGEKYYESFYREGELLRVGDAVEINLGKATKSAGEIVLIWEDKEGKGEEKMEVRWFYTYSEIRRKGGMLVKSLKKYETQVLNASRRKRQIQMLLKESKEDQGKENQGISSHGQQRKQANDNPDKVIGADIGHKLIGDRNEIRSKGVRTPRKAKAGPLPDCEEFIVKYRHKQMFESDHCDVIPIASINRKLDVVSSEEYQRRLKVLEQERANKEKKRQQLRALQEKDWAKYGNVPNQDRESKSSENKMLTKGPQDPSPGNSTTLVKNSTVVDEGSNEDVDGNKGFVVSRSSDVDEKKQKVQGMCEALSEMEQQERRTIQEPGQEQIQVEGKEITDILGMREILGKDKEQSGEQVDQIGEGSVQKESQGVGRVLGHGETLLKRDSQSKQSPPDTSDLILKARETPEDAVKHMKNNDQQEKRTDDVREDSEAETSSSSSESEEDDEEDLFWCDLFLTTKMNVLRPLDRRLSSKEKSRLYSKRLSTLAFSIEVATEMEAQGELAGWGTAAPGQNLPEGERRGAENPLGSQAVAPAPGLRSSSRSKRRKQLVLDPSGFAESSFVAACLPQTPGQYDHPATSASPSSVIQTLSANRRKRQRPTGSVESSARAAAATGLQKGKSKHSVEDEHGRGGIGTRKRLRLDGIDAQLQKSDQEGGETKHEGRIPNAKCLKRVQETAALEEEDDEEEEEEEGEQIGLQTGGETESQGSVEQLLMAASSQLQLSRVPYLLPCRDREKQYIWEVLKEGVSNEERLGRALYVSGLPGTGKTSTVMELLRSLKKEEIKKTLPPFDVAVINGMKLSHPAQIYTIIWKEIAGEHQPAERARDLLVRRFEEQARQYEQYKQILVEERAQAQILQDACNRKKKTASKRTEKRVSGKCNGSGSKRSHTLREEKEVEADAAKALRDKEKLKQDLWTKISKRKPLIILVDELDYMITNDEKVLYNLFDWPSKLNSGLVVVGIANTMDLPERLMPKISSRLGISRLVFPAYDRRQIEVIIQHRLERLGIFDQDAIEFAARKVSSFSGDIRRALLICRRAVEIRLERVRMDSQRHTNFEAGQNAETIKKDATITIDDINKAARELSSSPMLESVRMAPLYWKYVIVCMCQYMRYKKTQYVALMDVFQRLCTLCRLRGSERLSLDEVIDVIHSLAATGVLSVMEKEKAERGDVYPDVMLNMRVEDVEFALQGEESLRSHIPSSYL